jgi:hypothetical protein
MPNRIIASPGRSWTFASPLIPHIASVAETSTSKPDTVLTLAEVALTIAAFMAKTSDSLAVLTGFSLGCPVMDSAMGVS